MLLKRSTPQNIVLGGRSRRAAAGHRLGGGHRRRRAPRAAPLRDRLLLDAAPFLGAVAAPAASDYAAARVPMLPVTHGVPETTRQIALYSVLMVCLTLIFFAVARMGLRLPGWRAGARRAVPAAGLRHVARRDRCTGGPAVPLLDHVPDRAIRADHRRRLRLPAALTPGVTEAAPRTGAAPRTDAARSDDVRDARASQAAQHELHSANAAAGMGDSFVDEEIGECLLELGRPEEAARAFAAAVQQAERRAGRGRQPRPPRPPAPTGVRYPRLEQDHSRSGQRGAGPQRDQQQAR